MEEFWEALYIKTNSRSTAPAAVILLTLKQMGVHALPNRMKPATTVDPEPEPAKTKTGKGGWLPLYRGGECKGSQ